MEPSKLKALSEKHRLKTSMDKCGEPIIEGKHGHIYDYSGTNLGVMFIPEEHRPRLWTSHKGSAEVVGMRLIQDGDAEGCLVFDPESKEQVTLAFKIAKIRRRKQLSPKRLAELTAQLAKARNSRLNPTVESHFSS